MLIDNLFAITTAAIPQLLFYIFNPHSHFFTMSISGWLSVLSSISDHSHTLTNLDQFIRRLETELLQIQASQHDLPLCVLLLTDAIIVLKEESKEYRKRNDEPVLKEFIPSKKESVEEPKNNTNVDLRDKGEAPDVTTLPSVQLWSSHDNAQGQRQNYVPEIKKVDNKIKNFAASRELARLYQNRPYVLAPMAGCQIIKNVNFENQLPASGFSLLMPGTGHLRDGQLLDGSNVGLRKSVFSSSLVPTVQTNYSSAEHQAQSQNRKQRRCWSQDLHRSFVNALQQLGGAHVSTPKQIRDLMQVDGLTNDEVKSHLQKYRLHTKKGASGISSAVVNESGKTITTHNDHKNMNPSKPESSRSGSSQSALQFSLATGGKLTTAVDSMEDEGNSNYYSWKDYTIQTH